MAAVKETQQQEAMLQEEADVYTIDMLDLCTYNWYAL